MFNFHLETPSPLVGMQLKRAGVWNAFVAPEAREKAVKVLIYEKKCRKWWSNEQGVVGYFADVCNRAVTLLQSSSRDDSGAASTSTTSGVLR